MRKERIPRFQIKRYLSPLILTALVLLAAAFASPARGGEAATDSTDSVPSKALTFPLSYSGEGFANLSGGSKQGAIYEGLLKVGVQGDLDKLAGWQGGNFLVNGLYPHGPSLTDNYVHDFNRLSNIDAYDSVRLYEAWVQQELAEGKVSLRLGQILVDTEFFVSDGGALFFNATFGALPVVGLNFNAPIYPTAAPGIRVRWTATTALSMQAGLFDGDAGNPALENKHGVSWHLNGDAGGLAITEVAYKLNSEKENKGLRGVYKLGAFFHRSQRNDASPNAPGHANAGGYLVADQQLWRKPNTEDQGLSGFLRIGAAPEDRNTVPVCFNAGFNFQGLLAGRGKDTAGLGFSYTRVSGNLSEGNGDPLGADHEAIFEATYNVALNDWCNVQPDFQYIFNPGASQKAPNAVVAGLRCSLTFQ